MNYCPLRPYMKCPLSMMNDKDNDDKDMIEKTQTNFSFIRFLHASPNTSALDIYIDGKKAVSNLPYASMAGYAALPSKKYEIEVFPLGKRDRAILQFAATPTEESYTTFVIAGLAPNIQHRIYHDSKDAIPTNECLIRFVHMSPRAPSVDATIHTGKLLFSGITFGRTEEYIRIEPGKYNLNIRAAGTPNSILGLSDITFEGERAYTIYAIGILGGSPPLTAIMLSDGKR